LHCQYNTVDVSMSLPGWATTIGRQFGPKMGKNSVFAT